MLIDKSYFTGELFIDGLITTGITARDKTAVENNLNQIIAFREPEFIERLIGEDAAVAFYLYLNDTENANWILGDGKWNDVRIWSLDGKWTSDKWEILKNLLVREKTSPIANYVYFYYLIKNQSYTTPSGERVSKSSNEIVSYDDKAIVAWNAMVRMNIKLLKQLELESIVIQPDINLLETINCFGI